MKLIQEIVEQRISDAGRDLVFARAKELGWSGAMPPLWVWNMIAIEILESRSALERKGRIFLDTRLKHHHTFSLGLVTLDKKSNE